MVVTGADPSLKSQMYCLPMARVSVKSTTIGTHPLVSRTTPSMVVLIAAAIPARLNAIFTAAKLQPLVVPLLGAHTPGEVGNRALEAPPQLAHSD